MNKQLRIHYSQARIVDRFVVLVNLTRIVLNCPQALPHQSGQLLFAKRHKNKGESLGPL